MRGRLTDPKIRHNVEVTETAFGDDEGKCAQTVFREDANPMRFDLGVLIDFWFCLVFLGAIKTFTRWGKRSREQPR